MYLFGNVSRITSTRIPDPSSPLTGIIFTKATDKFNYKNQRSKSVAGKSHKVTLYYKKGNLVVKKYLLE